MKNKFYLKFSLIIIFSIFLLDGCLNYTQVTTLKIDGSGEMFIHYWVDWTTEADSLVFENVGIFNKDSIRNEFNSTYWMLIILKFIKTILTVHFMRRLKLHLINLIL